MIKNGIKTAFSWNKRLGNLNLHMVQGGLITCMHTTAVCAMLHASSIKVP